MRICALLILLLAGCGDQYRYFCQNPDNFSAKQCQKPRCEFDQTCPEYLIAPVLEKKIEGNPAQVVVQQQPTAPTQCR